jgi:glycosyltransferase involved in cell wall biosynthesis
MRMNLKTSIWSMLRRSKAPNDSASPTAHILVSAIVATYNAERFIKACLQDLVGQTLYTRGQLEIVVVDTGSPQNERDIVEEFQQSHRNIVYVRFEERETIYSAWKRGIRVARGRYLANANTDDRHRPDGLEILARTLDEHPDVDVVYGDSLVTLNPDATWEMPSAKGVFRWPDFDVRLLFDVCHMGPQPMWRRSIHDRHGLFDSTYRSAGDYEFWLRLATAGRRMKHVPQVVGIYLENQEGVSLSDLPLNWRESELARKRHSPAAWGPRPPTDWRSSERPWVDLGAVARWKTGKAPRVLLA